MEIYLDGDLLTMIIPEGLEIDENHIADFDAETRKVTIRLKEEEETSVACEISGPSLIKGVGKIWNYVTRLIEERSKKKSEELFPSYVSIYFEFIEFFDETLKEDVQQVLLNKQYHLLDFEIKIGFFKFVANILQVSWLEVLSDYEWKSPLRGKAKELFNIVGEDFIKSIINE